MTKQKDVVINTKEDPEVKKTIVEINTSAKKVNSRKLRAKQKKMLVGFDLENDINYRGPIGIPQLRIIGWLLMIFLQYCFLCIQINKYLDIQLTNNVVLLILGLFSDLALPCFLLSSFAFIMQSRENIHDILINYALLSLCSISVFCLLVYRYMLGIGMSTGSKFSHIISVLRDNFVKNSDEFFHFNIFIDLLIFTLFVYFSLETPPKWMQRVFKKNCLKKFRFCAILPILYEVVMFTIKFLAPLDIINPPIFICALLPTKSIFMFLAFSLIVLNSSKEHYFFIQQGGTEEEYLEFLKTKKNSLMFAKSTAKIFAKIGLIDLIITLIFEANIDRLSPALSTIYNELEIGESVSLLLFAPFVLLFSYNKPIKNKLFNLAIPAIGVLGSILMYFEVAYNIITNFYLN